jgi:2-dehydro-3-deoxyphosphogluconate aldolase/(4S)-4-hydroxy-2-oxoglutarate aldolase
MPRTTETSELLLKARLVAILRLEDLNQAVSLSQALLAGGIVAQEYTLTNPRALQAIGEVRDAIAAFTTGQAIIGVGSVRTQREAEESIRAGAQFVVSPILSAAVLDTCHQSQVPCMPGAMTPTEIASAWALGATMVKVFPARGLGPNYIKDVLAPMPDIKLMPTGGIDLHNLGDYFRCGASAVGVGGRLVDPALIYNKDWQQVQQIARQYADAVKVA